MSIKTIYFSSDDSGERTLSNLEFFSLMQDLKVAKLPLRQRLRAIIQEYSRYVKTKKSTLDNDTLHEIDRLLIQKFNTLINQSEEEIKANKDLSIVLGITDKDLKDASYKFSRQYKLLLIARDNLGYIPRKNQSNCDDAYKILIAALRNLVLGPVLKTFSQDPSALPSEIPAGSDLAKTLTNGRPTLAQLYDNIVGYMRKENIDANIKIEDNKIIITEIELDKEVEIL